MTMATTPETQITVDPDVPAIRIVREFDAAPEKVFRAHTDPELVRQWLGPRGMEMRIDTFDCRGSFHEVRPDEVIVQTFTYEGVPDGVALERMVFEDLGDGRTRLTGTSLVDTFEARDAMVASGMDTGAREGYERLDELLAR
jgi:uncharacterized protein YndB with AHSA1/START domain